MKEKHQRDQETGYDYRGARFYDSDIIRFLSVDPHAERYPSISSYAYVANNSINAIDPDGRDVFFINKYEANFVMKDLNTIYSEEYGFKNAFSIKQKEITVQEKNPNYSFWNPFNKEPEFIKKTETRHYLETNSDFNWNTDKYTKAAFDIVNSINEIKTDIIPSSTIVSKHPLKFTISDIKGQARKSSNQVLLSDNLKIASKKKGEWTFGGTFLHETIAHFHHLGSKEPAHTMQRKYGFALSRMNHNGAPTMGWSTEERKRLDELRSKTGKE